MLELLELLVRPGLPELAAQQVLQAPLDHLEAMGQLVRRDLQAQQAPELQGPQAFRVPLEPQGQLVQLAPVLREQQELKDLLELLDQLAQPGRV